jgi:hypothetical protein
LFGEIESQISRNFAAPLRSLPGSDCVPTMTSAGGKCWVGTQKVNCRAATVLRMAAQVSPRQQTALGDFYRRMRA